MKHGHPYSSRCASCHRHLLHRCHSRHLVLALPPVLLVLTLASFFLFGGRLWDGVPPRLGALWSGSSSSSSWSPSHPAEKARRSPFSFDLPRAADASPSHADWMADAPDGWSLAWLSLPGTHDTLTHRITHLGYRCQNSGLGTQLAAGIRYLDVRARVQEQPDEGSEDQKQNEQSERSERSEGSERKKDNKSYERSEDHKNERSEDYKNEDYKNERHEDRKKRRVLGVYHGDAYTGYELGDVLETVFGFLERHPTETVVVRLKEEGPPVNGSVDDLPGPKQFGKVESGVDEQGRSPFEAALAYYREEDERTRRGFAERVFRWSETEETSRANEARTKKEETSEARTEKKRRTPPWRVPTVGELRGRVLFLQEFPYFPARADDRPGGGTGGAWGEYGIPWALSSALLAVEDDWVMENATSLGRKWTSIRRNLRAAAAASRGGEDHKDKTASHGGEDQKDKTASHDSGEDQKDKTASHDSGEDQKDKAASPKLFLSHLSASVGVLPIDAAAGLPDGSVQGMNDQTGRWLVAGDDASDGVQRRGRPEDRTPVGIVIADFPGRLLVDAILRRNRFVHV